MPLLELSQDFLAVRKITQQIFLELHRPLCAAATVLKLVCRRACAGAHLPVQYHFCTGYQHIAFELYVAGLARHVVTPIVDATKGHTVDRAGARIFQFDVPCTREITAGIV